MYSLEMIAGHVNKWSCGIDQILMRHRPSKPPKSRPNAVFALGLATEARGNSLLLLCRFGALEAHTLACDEEATELRVSLARPCRHHSVCEPLHFNDRENIPEKTNIK
ncbi:MAG: hypothetical protein ACOH2J_10635 [Allorhizobium sp.]